MFSDEADVFTGIICGDFNARIGELNEYISTDNVNARSNIETVMNAHGSKLIDFLHVHESKLCTVHGRVNSINNKYTCVTSRG